MNEMLTTDGAMKSPAKLAGNRLFIAGIFVAALIPLFATPVLPFIDFYNHIARYFVLANIENNAFLQQNYQSNWTILPNIGLDIIVTGLMKILPYPAIPRLVIIMIFAVQYGGILYFNRALTGRLSAVVALLTVPLLYSFILNWGFANFLLGLGLVFWGAGWWVSQRRRLLVALPVACGLAILIFFVHGLAFSLYGLLLGALEIGLFLNARPRSVRRLVLNMAALALQAIVPVALFLAAPTSRIAGGVTNADESTVRLARAGRLVERLWDIALYRLTTIIRVAEGPSLIFDIVTLSAMAVLVALLVKRGRITLAPLAWPAVLMAVALVVVTPPALFGIGYVSDRMPLFLAMLLVGVSVFSLRGDGFETRVFSGMAALVAVRIIAIAADWHGYTRDNADFEQVARALPPGALIESVFTGVDRLDYDRRRCQMYGPRLIAEHGAAGRLFASKSAQPLRLAGPLLDTVNRVPRTPPQRSRPADFADKAVDAAIRSGFPWLLLCDGDRLQRPMPASTVPIATAGRFTLYGLAGPAAPSR
jgi:hypothetical protein